MAPSINAYSMVDQPIAQLAFLRFAQRELTNAKKVGLSGEAAIEADAASERIAAAIETLTAKNPC